MDNYDPYVELMIALKGEAQYKKELQKQVEEATAEYERLMAGIKDIKIPEPKPEYFSCPVFSECISSNYFRKEDGTEMNGYEKIENELNLDKIACLEKLLVIIRCDDLILHCILKPNSDFNDWEWEYDWWEGEEDVELIGAIALGDIKIEGNQLKYRE